MSLAMRLTLFVVMLLALTSPAVLAALPGTETAGDPSGRGRRAADELYPAAGKGRGADTAVLSGKWCSMSNDEEGGISGRCFTLYEDGSYEYYAETSSNGYYGSVLSRQSDSGSWSAAGSSLTATSHRNGTRTYSFEKRSHPQTGDPMLLIDGAPYVSFLRRRP